MTYGASSPWGRAALARVTYDLPPDYALGAIGATPRGPWTIRLYRQGTCIAERFHVAIAVAAELADLAHIDARERTTHAR